MKTANRNSSNLSVLMQKIEAQPSVMQKQAFRTFLMAKLRYLEIEEITYFVKELLKQETLDFNTLNQQLDDFTESNNLQNNRLLKKINVINKQLFEETSKETNIYSAMDKLVQGFSDLVNDIEEVSSIRHSQNATVGQRLKEIKLLQKEQQHIMYDSVEVILERLIESLNPESSESYMDNSVMKVGPMKKAAMFDAFKEKYDQVQAYQKEGKMLRDFKMQYKSEMKKIIKGSR